METKLSIIKGNLEKRKQDLQDALPSTIARTMTPDHIIKTCCLLLAKTPRLLQCTQKSILQSVMAATQLGLTVGGSLGEAYLVPYFSKEDKSDIAQLIIGYRGYIALARRTDEIESVNAQCVFENDTFEIDLGANEPPKHLPFLGERGALIAAYCVAWFKGGGLTTDLMTKIEIDKIRERSRAKKFGPWVTDYNEMARKTVVRRAAKYWPMSTEMAKAMELEDSAEAGDSHVTVETATQPLVPQTQQLLEDMELDEEPVTIDVEPKKNVNEEVAFVKKREQALHVLRETATINKVGNEEDLLASCKAYTNNYDLESVDSMTLPEIQTVIDKIENRG